MIGPLLQRNSMLLRIVLQFVASDFGQHIHNLNGVKARPFQDESIVFFIHLTGRIDALETVVYRLPVTLVQA